MAGIIDEQDPNVAVYTTKRSEKKQIWAGQVKKNKIVGIHTARKWEKIFRVKQTQTCKQEYGSAMWLRVP